MKGIILAGGAGTRLQPLTRVTNKCLLPVGDKPLIFHVINILKKAGIDDIMVITSPERMGDVVSLLGSGSEFDLSFTYRVQDKADGIASALKLCKTFVGDSKFSVVLGDNVFSDQVEIANHIRNFKSSNDDYSIFLKKVPDPQRFGVPVIVNEKIIDIIEKPKSPPTDLAVVGVYCYTPEAFRVIDELKPSARGEYEISDVNAWFIKNRQGSYFNIKSGWVDAGTHESFKKANEMMWSVK